MHAGACCLHSVRCQDCVATCPVGWQLATCYFCALPTIAVACQQYASHSFIYDCVPTCLICRICCRVHVHGVTCACLGRRPWFWQTLVTLWQQLTVCSLCPMLVKSGHRPALQYTALVLHITGPDSVEPCWHGCWLVLAVQSCLSSVPRSGV